MAEPRDKRNSREKFGGILPRRTEPPDFLLSPIALLAVAVAAAAYSWWRGEERRGEVGGQGDGAEGGGGVRGGRVPRRPLGGARLRGGGHTRQGAPHFAFSVPLPADAPPASPRSTHRACLLMGHRSWGGRALLACLLRVRSRFRSRRGQRRRKIGGLLLVAGRRGASFACCSSLLYPAVPEKRFCLFGTARKVAPFAGLVCILRLWILLLYACA